MRSSLKTILLAFTWVTVLTWSASGLTAPVDSVAAWSDQVGDGFGVFVSQQRDDEWSPPQLVAQSKNRILAVAVGSNTVMSKPNKEASATKMLAVWTEVKKQEWVLMYSDFLNGVWTPPKPLTSLEGENLSPFIIHDIAGNAWVFWSSNARGNDDIYSKRRTDGLWGRAILVNEENEVPDILPHAFLDKLGRVVVAWNSLGFGTSSYSRADRIYPLDSNSDDELTLLTNGKLPELSSRDIPLGAVNSTKVSLHFPQNLHKQSVYIDRNFLNPAAAQPESND